MKKKKESSVNLEYRGCFFHSLLELKFVLLIEDKCCWIREPFAIFYNPETLEVTNYITEKTEKYIPDFLVRKWSDNSAHLIEIKPKSFLLSKKMTIRKTVVENYLRIRNVDWKYKIITEDDIILSNQKFKTYLKIIKDNKNFKSKIRFINRDKKYNNIAQKYFQSIPYINSKEISVDDYRRYVKYGIPPSDEKNDNLNDVFIEYKIDKSD